MEHAIDMRSLRKGLGWSQGQMADYLGIDRSSVAHMEKNRPVPGPVRKLLAAITVSNTPSLEMEGQRA